MIRRPWRSRDAVKYRPEVTALEDRVVLNAADPTGAAVAPTANPNPQDVLMFHYDQLRTGADTNETTLTPQNVNPLNFGKLFDYKVQGQIYAEPLYLQNLTLPDGTTHNVVFVVTETDDVYALDADNPNAGPNGDGILWHDSYTDPAHTIVPIPSAELNIGPIQPTVGITGTPTIDRSTDTMYFVTETKQEMGPPFTKSGTYTFEVHAVDVTTGQELAHTTIAQATVQNGQTTINTSVQVPGTGSGSKNGVVSFDALETLQRPGLVLDRNVPGHPDGVVFAGFGSTHDAEPFHGWIVGWDAKTLQQLYVFNSTPDGYGGSFWQAGGGLIALNDGSLVVTSANGSFNVAPGATGTGPNALGNADWGLGYAGLDHSAAVTFSTAIPDSATNATGLFYNGATPGPNPRPQDGSFINLDDTNINFWAGARDQAGAHTFKVTLSYDGTDLHETIRDMTTGGVFNHTYYNANLQQAVGGDTAYVGIGSSTDARRSYNFLTGWTLDSGGTTVVNHPDGFSSHADLTANGDLQFTAPPPYAVLHNPTPSTVALFTVPQFDQASTLFYTNKVSISHFTTTFTFQMANVGDEPGDGFSLIVQNATASGGGRDYGDSMLRLQPTSGGDLNVAGYFTPADQTHQAIVDLDFGTASTIALPAMPGTAHPHLAVELAKDGTLYVVDLDNMGGLGNPYQSFVVNPVPNLERTNAIGLWGAMSFSNNTLYVHAQDDVVKAYKFDPTTQKFDPNPISMGQLPAVNFPGDSTTVSSNGTMDGIVWDLETDKFGQMGPAILHAYDASDLSRELYSSGTAFNTAMNVRDQAGTALKFTTPTVANGHVYVGTAGELDVYGLLPLQSGAPTAPTNFTAAPAPDEATPSITLTWSDDSNATGVLLYRFTPGETMQAIALVGPDQHKFTDKNLSRGVRYYYDALALNQQAISSPTPLVSAMA